MSRLLVCLASLALAVTGFSGCGPQLEDVPMPRLVSGPTYEVTAEFSDALNLPVDAPVKLDGATVGQVTAVEPGAYVAEVSMALSTGVELTDATRAEIRLTSPLGTAFVQLLPRDKGQPLTEGATIPVSSTSEAPDVADLLSALSTVVTGGSFRDISTIIKQLNIALTGNGPQVRQLLERLDGVVTDLNDEFPTLDRLTRGLDRLSKRLADDVPQITSGVTDLADLATSLERQRERMMSALDSLRRFEAAATPFTADIKDELVSNLDHLRTVVGTLVEEKQQIDRVMQGLIAFAGGSDAAAPGDYANFDLTFLLDPEALAEFKTEAPAGPQGGR